MNLTSRHVRCALALLSAIVGSCGDLGPVQVVDLCKKDPPNAECEQCQSTPRDSHCPQCLMHPPDPKCKNASDGGATAGRSGGGKGGSGDAGPGESKDGGTGANQDGGGVDAMVSPDAGRDAAVDGGGIPMVDAGPCGLCTSAKPACVAKTCVACAGDGDCKQVGKRHCDAMHQCVACVRKADCAGSKPECDTDKHQCVECLQDTDCTSPSRPQCSSNACIACTSNDVCATNADKIICDTVTASSTLGQCVRCATDADCANPTPECGPGHECVACTSDAACVGRAGTEVCDTEATAPQPGICVQCTVSEESVCAGMSCDPATRACTSTPLASRNVCQSCAADSECKTDYRCVPMEFQGAPRTQGYCLQRMSTGCLAPYAVVTSSRASLSGAASETYCGLDESKTTCEAITDLISSRSCSQPSDCGALGLDDGLCKTVGSLLNKCTYVCGVAGQCPGIGCGSTGYCGGP